jgi:ABC-type sugar transport system substrate-binding protein
LPPSPELDGPPLSTGRRIVVSLLTSQQEFQLLQASDARAAAQRAAVEVEVVFAENNAVQQIQQLYKFVHAEEASRPAGMIVEAVSQSGMERLARNALKQGISWVSLEWRAQYVAALRAQDPLAAVAWVAADEHQTGLIQARQFQALLPRGGRVLFIMGPQDSATTTGRFEGLRQGLARTSIEIKAVVNGDWTANSGEAAVASWLRLKSSETVQVDLIGSQNDSMATGAKKAIATLRSEWRRLPVTGCDGLPTGGIKMVDAGELAATIVKPTTAGPAIHLLAKAAQAPRGTQAIRDLVLPARSYPPLEALAAALATPRSR